MALDPQESQSREDELGSENLTCLLLQLFHNSSTTHIVLATLFHNSSTTHIVLATLPRTAVLRTLSLRLCPAQQCYAHCPCDSAPHSSATHIVLVTLLHNSSATHIVLVTAPQQQCYAHCPCDCSTTAVLRTLSL